jgi:lipoprotein-releasing system ATP-binding protein
MTYFCRMVMQATGIYKSYGQLSILRGVDLSIDRGEIVSIVGRSGSGKSTLLHILGTLDQADRGSINLVGTDLQRLAGKALAAFRNRHIGFVFQFHHLLPEFTALENVCMPAFIQGVDQRKAINQANELLDYLGLNKRLHHKPSELSGGEQQRVAVARALINQPDIVFADEPTGNLDSQAAQDLHQLLRNLSRERQHTFVIVTHNQELAQMSDRCLTMFDGLLQDHSTRSAHQ